MLCVVYSELYQEKFDNEIVRETKTLQSEHIKGV